MTSIFSSALRLALESVSDRLDRVEGAKAQCSNASVDQREGKRVEFADQLPSQPLANPRNLGQASSSRTHNVSQVHIDSALEEAHAILGLRSRKVLVDPHKDHKSHKDPNEEKDDESSRTIILEEDSEDEKALDEELIRQRPILRFTNLWCLILIY